MPRPDPWILAVAAALSAAVAVLVLFQVASAMREWRMRRNALDSLRRDERPGTDAQPQSAVIRPGTEIEGELMGALAERIPQLWDLHHLLGQSGLSWSLEGFMTRALAVATTFGIVALLAQGGLLGAGAAFAVGGVSPFFYVRWKKGRRLLRLESQLPDAIDLIARAVRAGHPLSEGLRMASEEAPDPLASEFRITFEEQKFGLPFE
jgi:tight adherence protein B